MNVTRAVLLSIVFSLLAYVAVGPLRILAPTPSAAQGETAAVQTRLDEDRKTLLNLVAAVQRLEGLRPKSPRTVTTTQLGCRANDKTFDNAPLIQAALDRGCNIHVDDGPLTYTSTLRIAPGKSCVISGESCGSRHWAEGVTGLAAFNESQPSIIEVAGNNEKKAGHGTSIRDLCLMGSAKVDGIVVTGGRVVSIEHVEIQDCRRGVSIVPDLGVYAVTISCASLFSNDTGIYVQNGTSVCCLSVNGSQIIGGRSGVEVKGWKRGITLNGTVIENQSEYCLRLEDARCTLIGSYLENSGTRCWMKASGLVGIDSTCGNISHNASSTVDWIGGNQRPYTVAFP